MRKILILTGEGIECEKESRRFFEQARFELEVHELPVPKLLRSVETSLKNFSKGDIVFLPGGFSFADHFGSGRLLSYQLSSKNAWQQMLSQGLHLLGVCNGFQVLVAAGFFGLNTKLLANESQGQSLGFINRWVKVRAENETFQLSVRHGEGRLHREGQWEQGVKPFLHYEDPDFDNGSIDQVAGLVAQRGQSLIFGLMPHPEVSFREIDQPDRPGPEFNEKNRARIFEPAQSGAKLVEKILAQLTQLT